MGSVVDDDDDLAYANESEGQVGERIGSYEIRSILARGPYATLYHAFDLVDKREAVVKMLNPRVMGLKGAVARFKREAHFGNAVRHPNIITYYHASASQQACYIAMEYFPGHTLTRRFANSPSEIQEALLIGVQIARAIQALHKRKIIHRDICPDNVLANSFGKVKVLDFSVSKALGQTNLAEITQPDEMLGTPAFMAPEQVQSPDKIDACVDVYGLGATLYFCLTGQPPYQGQTPLEIYQQIGGPVKKPSELRPAVPVFIEEVLNKAMALDPGERYARIDDFLGVLETFCSTIETARKNDKPGSEEETHDSSATFQPTPRSNRPPYLRIFSPTHGARDVDLPRDGVTIGRSRENGIVLDHKSVSRIHAAVLFEQGQYILEDRDSRSGTALNGSQVQREILREGDTIQITHFVLQYRTDDYMPDEDSPAETLRDRFSFLPSSITLRYRIVHIPPFNVFAAGDTLAVGKGGIFIPTKSAPPANTCVEAELNWPNGRQKRFLAEVMDTITKGSLRLMCVKLHQLGETAYETAITRSQRGPWITVPSI